MNIRLMVIAVTVIITVTAIISGNAFSKTRGDVDVVLVMDSSGSMKKTDPLSLRIPAAKLFISLLNDNDRAGVISFSDRGYPIIHLTSLNTEENRGRLLKATEKISSKGLYTNLYDALNKGLDVVSSSVTDKEKEGRERFLILMSDGMMDVGDPVEDEKLVVKIKNELTPLFEDKEIKVYTIAFTEQSDRELLENISKRTGGFFNLALTDKDFHTIFTSIFESLKTPEMLPMSNNSFLIDKSIEEVTIVATKDSPDTMIQLSSPNGEKYSYTDKRPDINWFASNNFDMITVKNPAEGRWEILFSSGRNNKAYVITNLKLQTNFDKLYTTFGDPFDIKIWLEKDGSPLKENDVLDKIDVYIELTGPDGETTKLTPFRKGEGIFLRRIAPFTPGNYKLRMVAQGKTFEREKTFVFNVADAKESKEDILAKREKEKRVEKPKEQKSAEKIDNDEISWTTVIMQFVSINFVLGVIVFVYIKRHRFKNIAGIKGLVDPSRIKGLLQRKREGKSEDQEEEQAQEEIEEHSKQAEDEKAGEQQLEQEDNNKEHVEHEEPEKTEETPTPENVEEQKQEIPVKEDDQMVGEETETPGSAVENEDQQLEAREKDQTENSQDKIEESAEQGKDQNAEEHEQESKESNEIAKNSEEIEETASNNKQPTMTMEDLNEVIGVGERDVTKEAEYSEEAEEPEKEEEKDSDKN